MSALPFTPSAPPPYGVERAHRRRLSCPLGRRQVRALLDQGAWQWTKRSTGERFTVANVYRKDRQVALTGPGQRPLFVTFADLGRQYAPTVKDGSVGP